MSFRLNKKWWGAVVALVLFGILALTLASQKGDILIRGVFTLLGRQPVLTLTNQSGEDVRELVADFSGGSAQWNRLEDGESVTLSLWLRGESNLTISWQDSEDGQKEWILAGYLESITYDKIRATILPDGKIEATRLTGPLRPSPVAQDP